MIKSKNVTSDCFANQKFVINCLGVFHNQSALRKVYSIGLLILSTTYVFSVFPEILKVYYVDLKKFINSVALQMGLLTCLICIYLACWNEFRFKQLFEKLQLLDELSNFNNAEGEIIFVKQFKNVVRKQTNFGILWINIIYISFILMTVIISLNEEKWILPFGSGSAIINNNNIQFTMQIITFGLLVIGVYLLIIIYVNVLTLICGHCKLLQKYIILSFTSYQGEIYKELDIKLIEKKTPDWESFKVQLQHIVPYHVGIIDVAKQMETAFSVIIFIFFGGLSIAMCLFIYHTQLNTEILETVKDAMFLVVGYSLMFIISIYGEKVATESGKIAIACYELDFVGCDLRIQKSLILIMAISQRPITPTIGNLKVVGLPTMLDIFQSIYSYYTILRNVMNK